MTGMGGRERSRGLEHAGGRELATQNPSSIGKIAERSGRNGDMDNG